MLYEAVLVIQVMSSHGPITYDEQTQPNWHACKQAEHRVNQQAARDHAAQTRKLAQTQRVPRDLAKLQVNRVVAHCRQK